MEQFFSLALSFAYRCRCRL